MVRSGKIRQDLNQLAVAKVLDDWTDKFYAATPRLMQFKQTYEKIADFGQNAKAFKKQNEKTLLIDPNEKTKQRLKTEFEDLDQIKCLYIWGHPGSGKSFISDLLYDSLTKTTPKKRAHFNEFMLEVHQMEHKVNKLLKNKVGETIAIVGNQISQDLHFLYLDEF